MASGRIKARTDSGWQDITTDGKIKYRLVDSIVYIRIDGYSMGAAHSTVAIPSAIAPSVIINPYARSGSTIISSWIDGTTLHFSSSSAMSSVGGFVSYPL